MTAEDAKRLMFDWAEGRRSWVNLGPNPPYPPEVIAVMDAQEVVKFAAIYAALLTAELAGQKGRGL